VYILAPRCVLLASVLNLWARKSSGLPWSTGSVKQSPFMWGLLRALTADPPGICSEVQQVKLVRSTPFPSFLFIREKRFFVFVNQDNSLAPSLSVSSGDDGHTPQSIVKVVFFSNIYFSPDFLAIFHPHRPLCFNLHYRITPHFVLLLLVFFFFPLLFPTTFFFFFFCSRAFSPPPPVVIFAGGHRYFIPFSPPEPSSIWCSRHVMSVFF